VFKNLMIYRIGPDWPTTAAQLEEALAQEPFAECGATQQKAVGWLPPRGQAHGALVESVGGQWIARFAIETKAVPADALKRKVQEAVDEIERTTGRHAGKKEQRDLRDDALLALLPQAFPRRSELNLWLAPNNRWLVIDTSSQSKADEVINSLVRTAGHGFTVALLQTKESPQAAMSAWLSDDRDRLPEAFDVGRDCELKGSGEEPAVIKFVRHDVATDEVRRHIADGNLPTKLALHWKARVRFALTHTLQLKQITFEEGVLQENDSTPDEDRFDADVALATGELGTLLADLIDALDGAAAEPSLQGAAAVAK
jgi:recombination associated protein RdgC